jgi:hypothetical protein
MNMLVQNHYKYMLVHYLFPNIHQLQFWFGEKKGNWDFSFLVNFLCMTFSIYVLFSQNRTIPR